MHSTKNHVQLSPWGEISGEKITVNKVYEKQISEIGLMSKEMHSHSTLLESIEPQSCQERKWDSKSWCQTYRSQWVSVFTEAKLITFITSKKENRVIFNCTWNRSNWFLGKTTTNCFFLWKIRKAKEKTIGVSRQSLVGHWVFRNQNMNWRK